MPSSTTKREGAVHTAGGFREDQSQFRLPLVRLGGRLSIGRVPRVGPMVWLTATVHYHLFGLCYPLRHALAFLNANRHLRPHVGTQKT